MMAKELQDWFPEAQISDQPVEKEGYLSLPLEIGRASCRERV